jgi:hypothetical protein
MAYFIFEKNLDGLDGTVYKIAETLNDLNNLNINKDDYKIIEDNNVNFDNIKLNLIAIQKYNDNTITYTSNEPVGFYNLKYLQDYINQCKNSIKQFTDNNPNHPNFNQWNYYYNQLNNLNLNNFTFPTSVTLEQYFKNNNQTYFSTLQLP